MLCVSYVAECMGDTLSVVQELRDRGASNTDFGPQSSTLCGKLFAIEEKVRHSLRGTAARTER